MTAQPILLVADEPGLRQSLFETFTRQGHSVDLAGDGAEALEKFRNQSFDLVVADQRPPQIDGLELLGLIKKTSPRTPVVIVSSSATVQTAVEAMRVGAFDYLLKPVSLEVIEETVRRALILAEDSNRRPAAGPGGENGLRPIVTADPGLERILRMARSVARSKATVLVQGESGTGKELLARYIHHNSDRATGPFVAINCASLPEGLLESELFGHEKGAFTGAVAKKSGKFELADQGTILLDEISEMDLALQAKLLRVLQEGEIDRVGGRGPVRLDVRVIATTNRDLKSWVAEGKFRQDLFYRLNVIPLTIPPLRVRPGDISLLVDYFLEKYSRAYQKATHRLASQALTRLQNHDWPGNVRELENIVSRGVLLAMTPEVQISDLFLDEPEPSTGMPTLTSTPATGPGEIMTIREMEKDMIYRALSETEGNRTHAAKILGISVRTLRNKLAEYNGMAPEPGGPED